MEFSTYIKLRPKPSHNIQAVTDQLSDIFFAQDKISMLVC